MDIRKVKKLIELLEESQVAEIEIHEGEESVRISRMQAVLPAQALVQAAPAAAMAATSSIAAPRRLIDVGLKRFSPSPRSRMRTSS